MSGSDGWILFARMLVVTVSSFILGFLCASRIWRSRLDEWRHWALDAEERYWNLKHGTKR